MDVLTYIHLNSEKKKTPLKNSLLLTRETSNPVINKA